MHQENPKLNTGHVRAFTTRVCMMLKAAFMYDHWLKILSSAVKLEVKLLSMIWRCWLDGCHRKLKVNLRTLDIAPLHSESPPQKRLGMARVLKGFHRFTCTPTRSYTIGMSHTCLCLPSYGWYSFTDPGGMEGWVDLGAKFEIRTCNLLIANPALYHASTSEPYRETYREPVVTDVTVEISQWNKKWEGVRRREHDRVRGRDKGREGGGEGKWDRGTKWE